MTDTIGCPHDQRVLWYYFAFQGNYCVFNIYTIGTVHVVYHFQVVEVFSLKIRRCTIFSGRWNPLPYVYNVWRLSFYPLKGIWSPLVRSYKIDDSLYYPMKGKGCCHRKSIVAQDNVVYEVSLFDFHEQNSSKPSWIAPKNLTAGKSQIVNI